MWQGIGGEGVRSRVRNLMQQGTTLKPLLLLHCERMPMSHNLCYVTLPPSQHTRGVIITPSHAGTSTQLKLDDEARSIAAHARTFIRRKGHTPMEHALTLRLCDNHPNLLGEVEISPPTVSPQTP